MKIIISGGGTGGHIFPAIAIANALVEKQIPAEYILFVGAEGRMEMEKIPQAGYQIIGLPVAGIQRKFSIQNSIKNILFPVKLLGSIVKAFNIIHTFKPNIVVGVGGYASGPVLWAAQIKKIPTLIQEQNSYAGLTNKWLGKKAHKICIAYEEARIYFPDDKIIFTGNPVRKEIADASLLRLPAMLYYKLDDSKKTILVIGGSLGALSINKAIEANIELLKNSGCQLIWQTGKNFTATVQHPGFIITPFIKDMHLAYGAADVVISRAGALSVSELCVVGKPCLLVPSSNVAEDHQTKNAQALAAKNAAILIPDAEAHSTLVPTTLALLQNEEKCSELKENIKKLAKFNAASQIAEQIIALYNV